MDIKENWLSVRNNVSAFYVGNKRVINVSLISAVAIVAGSLYYSMSFLPDQEKKAGQKLAPLYYYFKNDSTQIITKGNAAMKIVSAAKIADDYWYTKKGKEAALMASIAFMKEKKFKEALNYLDKTDAKDEVLNASILGMKAVCESELGNTVDAAKMFERASSVAENDFSAMYLKKAGVHYEMAGEFKDALRCYNVIADKYSTSSEGSDIDKYVYKMKAKLGELNP